MLRVLIAKDLRRAWRNPLPWLINIIVPLMMTALVSLAFGGKSSGGPMGRITFAIVDEDKSRLGDFLKGAANQGESGKFLNPVFLEREEALRQINSDKLSAVIIIPEHFMLNYLTGRQQVSLELIKNPAQSIHPAVLEELLGAVVISLNAVSRNFQSEFPDWLDVFEGKEDFHRISVLVERAGKKLEAANNYLYPPLISYEKEVRAKESTTGKGASDSGFNLFAFILPGMAGMFLLFLASNAMTDLHRELRFRTLERYHTLQERLFPFVAGKVVFTFVVLLICGGIMFGGGTIMFGIHWRNPFATVALIFGYAGFAAGLMSLLVAIMPDERRASALNTMAGMMLGIVGGCAFPIEGMPAFLREHVTPLLPSFWFVSTVRKLQFNPETPWMSPALKMAALSVILIALAALLFGRQFKKGLRT